MKKIRRIIAIFLIILAIPMQVTAASVWTGNGTYNGNEIGEAWGVSADEIAKITTIPVTYKINDMSSYSAYITNSTERLGNSMEKSFGWYNKSRLAYVKLFKVTPGQEISFLFADELYVYCAEYDSEYKLVNEGNWFSTGDKCTLGSSTGWVMLVFRKVNGDLSEGSGNETEILPGDVSSSALNYIIFKPFTYTLDPNGGTCMGTTGNSIIKRLGVSAMSLPTAVRAGYTFKGWQPAGDTASYKTLGAEYKSSLFKNTTLTAVWEENTASSVVLNKDYAIFEAGSGETVKLTATVLPTNTRDKSVTFTSSDSDIAAVDEGGLVTVGNKTGVAEITATSVNGKSASCKIYAMSFSISIPAYCQVNETYAINVNVYNNGTDGMTGRKRVLLDSDNVIKLVRVKDSSTTYDVNAQYADSEGGEYSTLSETGYLADTVSSVTVYYRLTPSEEITRAGDYESQVGFSVSVL